jgi:hypothetical protein
MDHIPTGIQMTYKTIVQVLLHLFLATLSDQGQKV